MKRKILLILSLFIYLFSASVDMVSAAPCGGAEGITELTGVGVSFPSGSKDEHPISFNSSLNRDDNYALELISDSSIEATFTSPFQKLNDSNGSFSYAVTNSTYLNFQDIGSKKTVTVNLLRRKGIVNEIICTLGQYDILKTFPKCEGIDVYQIRGGEKCYGGQEPACMDESSNYTVELTGLKNIDGSNYDKQVRVKIKKISGSGAGNNQTGKPTNGSLTTSHQVKGTGTFEIIIEKSGGGDFSGNCQGKTIFLQEFCGDGEGACSLTPTKDGDGSSTSPFNLCNQVSSSQGKSECQVCSDKGGTWTALGCIENSAQGIVARIIKIGLGIAGGVALLMILAAGFMFSTSMGEPKRTSEAKELLSSAIIGLLFIIFSVTILQFIGVTIFQLPGFGG